MVIYGRVWSCMVIYVMYDMVMVWLFMVLFDHAWSMVMYGHLWPCIVMYGNGHVLSCMELKWIERRSCVNSYEFVCLTHLCTIRACFLVKRCQTKRHSFAKSVHVLCPNNLLTIKMCSNF